jgi:hypothetical protein
VRGEVDIEEIHIFVAARATMIKRGCVRDPSDEMTSR